MSTPRPTILVPLDGSPLAEAALVPAEAAARRLQASLRLLAIPQIGGLDVAWYTAPGIPPGELESLLPLAEMRAAARGESEAYLTRQAAALGARGIETETRLEEDAPAPAILKCAREAGVLFVCMATHGRGGLTRWALGSVADRVVAESSRPIFLVRSTAGKPSSQFRRVLVPLDGSAGADDIIALLERVGPPLGMEVHLVHVMQPLPVLAGGVPPAPHTAALSAFRDRMAEILGQAAARLEKAGVRCRIEILEGETVAEALIEREASAGIDLVAMTTHGRSGVRASGLGSVADRVLRHGKAPVLLVRSGTRASS